MAEWSTCPHCQLKHSLRGDGLCPRCQQPVGAEASAAGFPSEIPPGLPGPPPVPPPVAPYPAAPLPPMRHPKSGISAGRIAIGVIVVLVVIGLKIAASVGGREVVIRSMFDLGDDPIASVEGRELGYQLTLPASESWYLREAADAAKDNPDADRWVVCPGQNAHIVTVVEEIELGPGEYIDLDSMVKHAIDTTRANAQSLEVVEQTPLTQPAQGKLLHTKSVVEGIDIESYHALFVNGPRAYQVLAFTERKNFAGMRGGFEQAIRSLRLPGA